METDSLLDPIAADSPCGPDLEYDRDFMALDQAAQGKPEQQFGDTVVPAEEPDWKDVGQRAAALFSRTKDLRVAALLARALTRTEGMPGLASGLNLVRGLLERYWDHVHPALDPDDGLDPTMRLNALAPLADADTLLRDVRSVRFNSVAQHAHVSMREVLIALGKQPGDSGSVPGLGEIDEILRAPQNAEVVAAAGEAVEAIAGIRRVLVERCGEAQGPDLAELAGLLKAVIQAAAPAADIAAEATEEGDAATGGVATGVSSEIRSREDVVRMLDKICSYIERTEPANPAPLLIRRAQRLLTKNFVEIINDLVPDSLSQIQHIAGIESD
ncbi:MAG: type VI secretion system protein TssA [Pseudolabrys sp.]